VARDRFDRFAADRRFDEEHVGAGFAIARAALERSLQTFDRDGVAARDDHEIAIVARVTCSFDFRHHSAVGTTRLPARCPQRLGHAWSSMCTPATPAFHNPDGAPRVDRIAIARIGVGDDGQPDASTMRAALSTISVAVSSPTSACPGA
jgi:hypothetical protein